LFKVDLIGFLAAVLTTLAFLPQTIKVYKSKSADDLSYILTLSILLLKIKYNGNNLL